MTHAISVQLLLFLLTKSDAGWEETVDYVFPDDETAQPSLKLLALAKKWKEDMQKVNS